MQLVSIEMDIRGVSFPLQVLGIPIRKTARRVHLLHGAHFIDRPGNVLGKYVFHLVDGKKKEQPIVYNEHVRDRCSVPPPFSTAASAVKDDRDAQAVFLTTWNNPHPETEIVMMDFISHMSSGAPFLIAVTTERNGRTANAPE